MHRASHAWPSVSSPQRPAPIPHGSDILSCLYCLGLTSNHVRPSLTGLLVSLDPSYARNLVGPKYWWARHYTKPFLEYLTKPMLYVWQPSPMLHTSVSAYRALCTSSPTLLGVQKFLVAYHVSIS